MGEISRRSRAAGALSTPLAVTALYYTAFTGLGLTSASLGPTLPALAELTGSSLGQASILFSARALGYLLGSLLGGRLYDRRSGHPVMAAALLLAAGMMCLAPVIPLLWLLALALLVLGGAEGTLDVGGNTLLVWLHGEKVSPFMNGLHLFFGVGSFLSPLLIAQVALALGRFSWAYWLLAALLLPAALLLLVMPSPASPSVQAETGGKAIVPWPLVFLIALFFLTFVGAEGSYGGWIYSYAVASGFATPQTAAYLTSAFWGAFTLGRLVSIPLALRFRPRPILIADLAGCLISLGIAAAWGQTAAVAWLATILFGLSIASIFPTTLSYAAEAIPISGQVTSVFFVGVSAGSMIVPWLIGQFFEPLGPGSAMAILFIDMLVSAGIFACVDWVRRHGGRYGTPAS
jgi:fucose permease